MKTVLLFIVFLVPFVLFCQSAKKEHDFRNADWGMRPAQVIKSEKIKLSKGNNDLYGTTEVSGMPVIVLYSFTNDKLTSASYLFEQKHTNQNDYIDDYNRLKKFLSKKYGDPLTDIIDWSNELYKDNYDAWGMAVGMGYLIFKSSWLNDKSSIALLLMGENFKINMGITYISLELDELRESAEEEEALEGL